VCAGGSGTPEFDVTQSGGGPSAFVAIQSAGNDGGITSSKFSLTTIGRRQGGEQEGVGTGVGVGGLPMAVKSSNGRWPMLVDGVIAANVTATTVAATILARLIAS
jgi:hypothetical protein